MSDNFPPSQENSLDEVINAMGLLNFTDKVNRIDFLFQ